MALQEGRYTYRHDNILKYISDCLDRVKFTCYVDIPGCQTPAGGTLPPSLVVTALRPDIVIIDKQQAGAELGQAQIQLELGLTLIKI